MNPAMTNEQIIAYYVSLLIEQYCGQTSPQIITFSQVPAAGNFTLTYGTRLIGGNGVVSGIPWNATQDGIAAAFQYENYSISSDPNNPDTYLNPNVNPALYSPAIWYNSANFSSITQHSGLVSAWNNLGSLASTNAIASGSARPTYNSSLALLNKQPTISFDGVANVLSMGTTPALFNGSSFTMFMVFATKAGFTPGSFPNLLQLTTDDTEGWILEAGSGSQYADLFFGSKLHWASGKWPMPGNWSSAPTAYLLQINYNGSGDTVLGNFSTSVNGNNVSVTATGSLSNSVQNASVIGAGISSGTAVDFAPIDVAELALFTPALTPGQAFLLQNSYFNLKYVSI